MADSQSKIDAAAEKAFAEAAEKKTADAVSAKKVEQAVEADTTAPVKADAVAKAVAAKPAKKVAAKKAAPKKAVAKTKAEPKKVAAKKAAPVQKPAPSQVEGPVAAKTTEAAPTKAASTTRITQLKDTIMATAHKTATTDYSAKAKEVAADMQTRAKAAYDKGTELTKDAVEFQKGNFEALVESGKILASGMQDMGRTYVEEAKTAAETVQADVKKFAAVKSPTELFQLQGEIARRNFDAMVKTTSKNTEAMLKLANEAFAPVSNRMSLAAEKVRKAA